MTYDPLWQFYFNVFQFLVNIVLLLGGWWKLREKVSSDKFKEHDKRLSQLENDVRHPDCKYHVGFETRLDKLNGCINRLDGRLEGLGRALDLINEFLINQGGKK